MDKKTFVLILLVILVFSKLCTAQNNQEIMDQEPKYNGKDLIKFNEVFNIDISNIEQYYMSSVGSMDIDSDSNLYVLAHYDYKMMKFDKDGNFIEEFGGAGHGPRELAYSSRFYIHNDRIYIFEETRGIKIWDLNGKYIDYIVVGRNNGSSSNYKPFGDFFIGSYELYEGDVLNADFTAKYKLSVYDNNIKVINEVTELVVDPIELYLPFYYDLLAVDSKLKIYYPENATEYKINKYDLKGKKQLTFGRKYDRQKYSKAVHNYFKERGFDKELKPGISRNIPRKLPKYPPIIRDILVDDDDLIWVIVGEWYEDSGKRAGISSTIDIFSSEGEFLYTFETDILTSRSFIKNGMLYSQPRGENFKSKNEDSCIRVYKIIKGF